MDWYTEFKAQGEFDSNYYYRLQRAFKIWIIDQFWQEGKQRLGRTDWIKITDKATDNVNKFIWHLKLYVIAKQYLPSKPEHHELFEYQLLLNDFDKPTHFKVRYADHILIPLENSFAKAVKEAKQTHSTTVKENDKRNKPTAQQ